MAGNRSSGDEDVIDVVELLEEGPRAGFVGGIQHNGAHSADFGACLSQPVGRTPGDDHLRPFGVRGFCRCQTDPGATAEDDNRCVFERHTAQFMPSPVLGPSQATPSNRHRAQTLARRAARRSGNFYVVESETLDE